MSFVQRIIEALDARMWKFIRLIHNVNHDYPYHDFVRIFNMGGEDPIMGTYNVGESNLSAGGDQHKRFVSKHTNIWMEGETSEIKFNDANNVPISLPYTFVIGEGDLLTASKHFYTNISSVHYKVPIDGVLYIYCEGVLPEEARDAE